MPNIFLKKISSADSIVLASAANVYGFTQGEENLSLIANGSTYPTGVVVDQTIEKVTFEGSVVDFVFKKAGTTDVLIYKASDTSTVVATVHPQTDDDVGSTGTIIAFTSGPVASTALKIIDSSTIRIGGQDLTTTAAAFDITAPTVTSFTSTTANGSYKVGSAINVTATMSEAVTAGSTFVATLDTGDTVTLTAASNGTTLTGTYTVGSGDTSADLAVASMTAGTVTDLNGNAMTSTTSFGSANIALTSAIVVDTTAPTATATTATIANSGNATVQSSELGTAYLVKNTVTVTNLASITGADGNDFNSVTISTANSNTSLSASGLNDGTYKVYTVDAAGNLSAASSNSVTIDTTAPTASVTTASLTSSGNASVQSTEAGTVYLVKTSVTVTNLASITGANGTDWNSVSVSANSATNLATTGLAAGTYKAYAVDSAGNLSAASTNIITIDDTAPTLSSSTPADDATAFSIAGNIVLTFDEAMTAVTGHNIVIKKTSDDSVVATIDAADGQITIVSNVVTINPTITFDPTTEYYIQIASGSFTDAAGNAYTGISSTTALSFTTGTDTFTVTNTAGVLTFGGTATGAMTMSMADSTHGTFTRSGVSTSSTSLVGVTEIDDPNDAISITATIATDLIANSTKFNSGDALTVNTFTNDAAAVTAATGGITKTNLGGASIKIDGDNAITLTAANAASVASNTGVRFNTDEVLTVNTFASDAAAITAATGGITTTNLGGASILIDGDNAIALTAANAASVASNTGVRFNTDEVLTVNTFASDAAAVTAATGGITKANLGGTSILIDGDNAITLTAANAASVASNTGVRFNSDEVLTVNTFTNDAAAVTAAAGGITTTNLGGSSIIIDGDNAITLTAANAASVASNTGVRFNTDEVLTVNTFTNDAAAVTAATGGITTTNLGGTSIIIDGDNAITLTAANAASVASNTGVRFNTDEVLTVNTFASDAAAVTAATGGITTTNLGGASILIDGDNAIALTAANAASVASNTAVRFNTDEVLTVNTFASDAAAVTAATGGITTTNLGGASILIDGDNAITLTAANAASVASNTAVRFNTDEVLTVNTFASDAAAVTAATGGITTTNLGGASIVIDGDNAIALTNTEATNVISNTGVKFASDEALTITVSDAQVANAVTSYTIAALGGASIVLDGDNAITLSAANAATIEADAARAFASDEVLTVDTFASDAAAVTAATGGITKAGLGGTSILIDGDNAITLTAANAASVASNTSVRFNTDEVLTVNTFASDAAAITAATGGITKANLGGTSILIDGDNAITLTAANAASVASNTGVRFNTDEVLTVNTFTNDAAAIAAATGGITTSTLGGASIVIDGDNTIALTKAEAASVISNTSVTFATDDNLTISGAFSASDDYSTYSATDLGGVRFLDDDDDAVTIDKTDLAALVTDLNLLFTTTNDVITVTGAFDAVDDYAAYSAGAVGGASRILDDSDDAVALDKTDLANLISDAGLAFTTTGDVLTVTDAFDASDDYSTFSAAAVGGASRILEDDDDAVALDKTDLAALVSDANLKFSTANDVLTVTGAFSASDDYSTFSASAVGGASRILEDDDNAVALDKTDLAALVSDTTLKFSTTNDVLTVSGAFNASDDYSTFSASAVGGASRILDDDDDAVALDKTDLAALVSDTTLKFTTTGDVLTVSGAFNASDDYSTFSASAVGGASRILDDDDDAVALDKTDLAALISDTSLKFTTTADVLTVSGAFSSSDDYSTFSASAVGGASRILDDDDDAATIDKTDLADLISDANLKFTTTADVLTITGAFSASDDYSTFSAAAVGGASRILDDSDDAVALDKTDLAALVSDTSLKFTTTADVLTISGTFGSSDDYSTFSATTVGGASRILDDNDDDTVALDKTDLAALVSDTSLSFTTTADELTITGAFDSSDDYSTFSASAVGGALRILNDDNNAVTIDKTDLAALVSDATLRFDNVSDAVTVTGAFDNTDSYSSFTATAVGGATRTLDDDDDAATIDATDAANMLTADVKFATADVITVSDTGANFNGKTFAFANGVDLVKVGTETFQTGTANDGTTEGVGDVLDVDANGEWYFDNGTDLLTFCTGGVVYSVTIIGASSVVGSNTNDGTLTIT